MPDTVGIGAKQVADPQGGSIDVVDSIEAAQGLGDARLERRKVTLPNEGDDGGRTPEEVDGLVGRHEIEAWQTRVEDLVSSEGVVRPEGVALAPCRTEGGGGAFDRRGSRRREDLKV